MIYKFYQKYFNSFPNKPMLKGSGNWGLYMLFETNGGTELLTILEI